MSKCVYDTRTNEKGCYALKEKVCNKKECHFYKSDNEYRLTEDGYVEKRGNDLSQYQY